MQASTRQGHTRIEQAALRHTLEAVAAGAFKVRSGDVSATLHDDAGKLGVDLQVRLPPPPLLGPALAPGASGPERQPAFEQARIARLRISSLGQHITGLQCGRINIRLGAGGRAIQEDRVDSGQDRRRP
ncbi:hypothetical protein [Pseudarthrobacter sp. C4D7]|uniref:hypothetical protein n=1 Tax=Pseudarthrobacter sp. C4D7 TaxID=2735268 RepID=UPI0015848C7A|nr:hypothetical protein [Pseudarthrobacter sp. C4D7]